MQSTRTHRLVPSQLVPMSEPGLSWKFTTRSFTYFWDTCRTICAVSAFCNYWGAGHVNEMWHNRVVLLTLTGLFSSYSYFISYNRLRHIILIQPHQCTKYHNSSSRWCSNMACMLYAYMCVFEHCIYLLVVTFGTVKKVKIIDNFLWIDS